MYFTEPVTNSNVSAPELISQGNIFLSENGNPFNSIFTNAIILPSFQKEIKSYSTFFTILYEDCNVIYFDEHDNKSSFAKLIKKLNKPKFLAQLLGTMAESLIVRRCNADSSVKKNWFNVSCGTFPIDKIDESDFIAIATGSHRTKNDTIYKRYYNPNDTQRDIIWVNRNNHQQFVLGFENNSAFVAGLQVKTSFDGDKYIGKSLLTNRYVVPIVYFDISNDYLSVIRNIQNQGYNGKVYHDLISAKDIDFDCYNELLWYSQYLYALSNNRLTIENFLNNSDITSKNSIAKTLIDSINPNNNAIISP